MRSARFARGLELLRMSGSATGGEVIAGLGARGALAIGVILPSVLLLEPSSANLFTISCSAFAMSAGIFLTLCPTLLPLALLDALLIGADTLLALLGIFDDAVQPALPGTYLVIGTIVFAVRTWQVATMHGVLLSSSYGAVLIFGPHQTGAVVRWLCVSVAVATAGLFIRWLVGQVLALAGVEAKARAAAEQTTDELQRISAMRSTFLARMSHELRTPLNTVLGFSDLLAEQLVGPLTERQLEYTRDISSAARHQVELVDDVLDLAKVESGLHELNFETLDVAATLYDAVRLVREGAERKGLKLDLQVAPDLGLVADRLRIRQVVVNLLANAVKFTPPGGEVSVRAQPVGADHLVIEVRDTGIGMTPDDLAVAFEEYSRIETTTEGTGLGLPLARRFTELHGGTLSAASSPGSGSVFRIDLPIRPQPVDAVTGPTRVPAAEHADYTAFTQPGSTANRALITAITSRYLVAGGVLFVVVAAVSSDKLLDQLLLAAFGVASAAAAPLLRWRFPAATRARFEALAWIGIAAITGLTLFAGSYISIAALGYACVVMTGFALWPRRRAVLQLFGIAAAYAIVVVVKDPGSAALRWLSVLVLLTFQADIVSRIAMRLRKLVIAEQEARETAERAGAELAAMSRHKSAFLANMSHELRTPLNAIIGFADLLGTELAGPLNDRQRDFVTDIQAAARHLLRLITLALDVAKLEAGRMPLRLDVVGVRGLIERAVDTARVEEHEGCSVEMDVRQGADYVIGDPHLLQQAVAQLIGNALQFNRAGGLVSVVATPASDDSLEIDVHDSGTGVAEQHSEMIFEPFHQADDVYVQAAPQGAGLGLSLVRGVAELHGGRVWFTTAQRRGTTFSLIIPRLVSGADALTSAVEATA